MKKLAIAGASLALAAMPMAGVFAATTTVVDNISVGVKSSCQIGTDGESSTQVSRSYSATNQLPGTLVSFDDTTGTPASTPVAIKCNNSAGYTLTPTFTSLTNASSDAIAYDGTAVAEAGDGEWSAEYSLDAGTTKTLMTNNGVINGNSTMTDTYNFFYNVGLDENQPAGTYTGTATYLLAAK